MSKYCTKCGNPIKEDNKFCNSCGNRLKINIEHMHNNGPVNNGRVINDKNPWLAALLSFFFMCFGQFYNGQILKGIIFIVIIMLFLSLSTLNPVFSLLYLCFGLYVVYDAYKNAKKSNEIVNYS